MHINEIPARVLVPEEGCSYSYLRGSDWWTPYGPTSGSGSDNDEVRTFFDSIQPPNSHWRLGS